MHLASRRDGRGLAQLMSELGKLEGLHWMRILYAYPSYFSDELIDEIANNPKVCVGLLEGGSAQLAGGCAPVRWGGGTGMLHAYPRRLKQ